MNINEYNKNKIEKLLINSIINNIFFERGYGLLPAKFIIALNGDMPFSICVETNFRIRDEKNNLLSFDDMFLDFKQKELSIRKYRSQKNIEKSYLGRALLSINDLLKDETIKEVEIKEYGDMIIKTSNHLTLEIINDTHLNGGSIFYIMDSDGERRFEMKYLDKVLTLIDY